MSNEHVVLCGELSDSSGGSKKVLPLRLWGKDDNVTLKIRDISEKMAADIPPVLVDLLEVATYVYCADQAATRGGKSDRGFGANWRRRFQFHIPVREPKLWSSDAVLTALRDTLGFLSDDEYEFTFKKLTSAPPVSQYLDFAGGSATGFQAEKVILFSGGIDSLGGAVQEAVANKRKIALVSHRSSPQIATRQKDLLKDLGKYCSTKPFHVPVWVNKEKSLGREYTQRTRSFLYASLATVVARIFGLCKIEFFENGVVSINLPIAPQVIGGRATRTTHPQVINGFSQIFTALLQKPFAVENPFLWMTKAEVVRSIREAGCGDLIKYSTSCTHVWEMTNLKTHCGKCSQCISRRFATLSAGCPDKEDPEEIYETDLLKGERKPGESRTMLESYVQSAKQVKDMSDSTFFSEFGEVHRVTRHIKGTDVDTAASKILDLHKRHAAEVTDVIAKGIQDNAKDIVDNKIPNSCLLILALPDDYKRSPAREETPPPPLLILDEIKDGEANRGLLARVVGSNDFDGVNKKIGSRELFFVYQLFNSTRTHNVAGEYMTVITEEEAVQTLLQWSKNGYLQFSGKDKDSPAHRIQKMWGEFVRQIGKEKKLKGIFTNQHKDINGQRLYGLRLSPKQKQILVSSIPALFPRVAN
jgi:hypothetical protein